MAQKCEAPAATGATRDLLAGFSRLLSTVNALRSQYLIARGLRADLGPIVAAILLVGEVA